MKRYFFDYHDNGSCERDEIGLEFDSLEAASKEAERALSEFASDVLPDGADRRISIDVRSGEDVVFQTGMRIQSGLTD